MRAKGVYLKCRDGDGKEVWYYHVSYQRKQIHRRGGSLQAAIRGREKAQERIDLGLSPFPEKTAKPPTVAAVVQAYVGAQVRREKERAETFAAHLSRLLPERVNLISEITLRRYREDRKKEGRKNQGVKDSTVNRELLFLAAACRHAKCGTFFDSLDKKSRPRIYAKEDPGQPDRLSDADVQRIAENLPAVYRNPTWLALLTGMRQQEILGLTWAEVRGSDIRLPGNRTKSGYPRTVFLADEALALLPKRGDDGALVFRGESGGALWNNFGREWRRARKAAKLPTARFHDLRHEWASRYVEAGGTLIELMQAGGWRTLSQVQRYSKAEKARIRETLNALAQSIKSGPRIAPVLLEVSAP
jgi:integrase